MALSSEPQRRPTIDDEILAQQEFIAPAGEDLVLIVLNACDALNVYKKATCPFETMC
jgi:hypothetical protein